MKVNESGTDRILRVVVGVILVLLYVFGVVGSTLGLVLTVVGAVALVTGLTGFCPLYAILKVKTLKS